VPGPNIQQIDLQSESKYPAEADGQISREEFSFISKFAANVRNYQQ